MQAMPYIKDIIGVGLARGIPNWKGGRASHTSFAPLFKRCKDMGLHLTAHAGVPMLLRCLSAVGDCYSVHQCKQSHHVITPEV